MSEKRKAMTIRLPEEQAEALEAMARVEGVPVSEEIRRAIDARLETRRKDRAFQQRLRASLERNQALLEKLANS